MFFRVRLGLPVPFCLFLGVSFGHFWAGASCAQAPNDSKERLLSSEKFRFEHLLVVPNLAFSPDGKLLAVSGKQIRERNNAMIVWETDSGAEKKIVGPPRIWDFANSQKIPLVPPNGGFIAFDPTGKQYWVYMKGAVQIRDGKSGDLAREIKLKENHIRHALSPDASLMASFGAPDYTLKLWKAQSGEAMYTLKGHEKTVASVAFSPSGKRLASASWDKTVKVWDTQSGELARTVSFAAIVASVAYSPDGKWLAVGFSGDLDKVSILDAATYHEVCALARASRASTQSLKFNPKGSLLAAVSGHFVQVWEISEPGTPRDKARETPKKP